MAKILYVEDDDVLAANVQDWLQREGHIVELADDGEDGLQLCKGFDYDVLLLDWDLPSAPGIEICKKYRAQGGNAWVFFITGKDKISDKENGLEAGADDYITKPFDIRELSARIRSALRRTAAGFQSELKVNGLTLDSDALTITVADTTVRLMPKEAALLQYLMRHTNKVIGSDKLLSSVWPSDSGVSNGNVRTFMLNLRKKLDEVGKKDMIKTIPNAGYIIETAP